MDVGLRKIGNDPIEIGNSFLWHSMIIYNYVFGGTHHYGMGYRTPLIVQRDRLESVYSKQVEHIFNEVTTLSR